MSKSELKRLATQDPIVMAEKLHRMEMALKVIYTWSNFHGLDTAAVNKLCAEALGIDP